MKLSYLITVRNFNLIKLMRKILTHSLAIVTVAITVPLGRKILVSIVVGTVLLLLLEFMRPYAMIVIKKLFQNPEIIVYNKCIFRVIENAPLDEEFSWRLSACGPTPARYKWPSENWD